MDEAQIRITDPVAVESGEIRAIINSGRTATIQFSEPGYTRELPRTVNQLCAEFKDKLEVRFFSREPGHFDASALAELPDARRDFGRMPKRDLQGGADDETAVT
jgi:hypothetical protein